MARPTLDLRARLLKRTLATGLLTALVLAAVLGAWAVHNTRGEIDATRALVRDTVDLLRRGVPEQGGSNPTAPADIATHRHVTITRVDPRMAADSPARAGSLSGSTERLMLDERTAIEIRGRASGELIENATLAVLAFLALAAFGGSIAAFQYRTVMRAFAPVGQITAQLARYGDGERSQRLDESALELAELRQIAHAFNRLADQLEQTLDEQQRLSQALLSLRAEERARLARDLHDELGQSLSAIAMHLAHWKAEHTAHAQAGTAVGPIEQEVHALKVSLRKLLIGLRAPTDEANVEPDIVGLLEAFRARHPQVTLHTDPTLSERLSQLPLPAYRATYRIVQECLTNCAKHARARHFWIDVDEDFHAGGVGRTLLKLRNDGVEAEPARDSLPRFGVAGMRERAASIGADLRIEHQSDCFEVRLRLPDPGAPT